MSAKKRVAIVAFSAPPLSSGGVASAHYNLHRALKAAGLHTKLFTFGDTALADSEEHILRSGSPAWWLGLVRFLTRLVFKVLQPGKRAYQSFDILAAMPGARAMAKRLRQWTPDVVVLSDHGAPGLALRRGAANLVLVSHHNPARFLKPPAPDNYSRLDARLALRWEQQVVNKVDAVVCPSKYMQDYFQRTYRFDGLVKRIPNLLDDSLLGSDANVDLKKRLGLGEADALVYLPSVGTQLKGAAYVASLIEELSARWNGNLAFYIPGEVEAKYQRFFERLAADGIAYLPGQVSYADNIGLARQCDFCVSLSLMENYSMALLEAALLGLPILAFDTGGNADIVQEAKNGFLFPLGATQAMAQRAEDWNDSQALRAFAQEALSYSRVALAPSHAQDAYVELIESL